MMSKSLRTDEIEEMKQLVLDGKSPEDISKKYGCAISTVHYYKKKFKNEGLQFASIRGQRPTGEFNGSLQSTGKSTLGSNYPQRNAMSPNYTAFNPSSEVILVVDGVEIPVKPGTHVNIDSGAKSINISQGKIEINY